MSQRKIIPIACVFALVCAPAHAAPDALCRIANTLPAGATNLGSGTLVDVTADGQRGLVLTCAHLFSEGVGQVGVEFADGRRHGGLLVAKDERADLAAVEIAKPQAAPVSVVGHDDPRTYARLTACGFGSNSRRHCLTGRVVGRAQSPGRESFRIVGAVRSGDSGGGVFNDRGELVAVVWGATQDETYATTGAPLRTFLSRFRRTAPPCRDGQCPRAPSTPKTPTSPRNAAPPLASPPLAGEQASPPPAVPAPPTHPPNRSRLCPESLPIAVAVAALAYIAWRLFRKRQEAPAAADKLFRNTEIPEAGITAETITISESAPIERDDREARQLLRLSQLEGRDPLQDALAGRLALDRLDEIAESNADHAAFADSLRRELRERFNEVAPTKFEAPT